MELNNDELGEMGENRFAELCARAKLICNKSHRDRGGWDFLVEFGFDAVRGVSLDKRPGPMSCHVQVKTISAKAGSVRMALNMAERLAKEQKPSFLFVLRATEDKEDFSDAYLLHIIDDKLASILKRLRKESAKSSHKTQTNQMEITFTPKAEDRIDVTGFALRSSLQHACGSDVGQYGLFKGKQLKELGYTGAPYQLKVSFDAVNQIELEEAFLGSKKSIPVSSISAYETRFDITLPEYESVAGTIVIEPASSLPWSIVFRAPGLMPASFKATAYVVPAQISGERRRMRVSSDHVEINFTSDDAGSRIDLRHEFRKSGGTIDEWFAYYRMCQTLHLRGTIEMETPYGHGHQISLRDHDFEYLRDASALVQLCEKLVKVAQIAGLDPTSSFQWDSIADAHDEIMILHSIIDGEQTSIEFNGIAPDDLRESRSIPDMILLHCFKIGDSQIAYSMKANVDMLVQGSEVKITLSSIEFRAARMIPEGCGIDWYAEHVRTTERTDRIGWFRLGLD